MSAQDLGEGCVSLVANRATGIVHLHRGGWDGTHCGSWAYASTEVSTGRLEDVTCKRCLHALTAIVSPPTVDS